MNSNYGKNFDFDLGLGSSRNNSLNDQKNKTSPYSSSSSSSSYASQSKPAWQPNKPAWTHQPAASVAPTGPPARPGLPGAQSSMVGDIFGKSWASPSPQSSGIGIKDKNPNLFGDLVNSALGSGKNGGSNSNVPLKNSTPVPTKSVYSMGKMTDSLPKSGPNWGSSSNYSGNVGGNMNRSVNPGGASMNNGNGGLGGTVSKDPFGSLLNFEAKPTSVKNVKVNPSNENAPKPSNAFQASTNPVNDFNFDNFVKPATHIPAQPSSTADPLDMFFTSSTTTTPASNNGGLQSEIDDWGAESGIGGDSGGPTTELDGLPPPPAGVNSQAAKNKGMDNYKQGQYADAIKWLSWAVVLLEKSGDREMTTEVLSSRASCYKEVGEYKKAVADCSKVLEKDKANVSVLVQRALLYESMEKYRLGAEDLRTVLKIDPSNRIARSTVHRLTKLAD